MNKNLLLKEELWQSSVVANCRMNRKRQFKGINSYHKDTSINLFNFLDEKRKYQRETQWVDLCCGEANALIQAKALLPEVRMEGIDLVGMFNTPHAEDIKLMEMAVEAWSPTQSYDLITCIHGFHYLGDKLKVLSKAIGALKHNGLFVANIDLNNIKNQEGKSIEKELVDVLTQCGVSYNKRRKIITCKGATVIKFPYRFIGANDQAGPNYTGQPVVDSYYTSL